MFLCFSLFLLTIMHKKHNEDEKKTVTLQTVSPPLHREVSLAVSARCDVTTAGVPFFWCHFGLLCTTQILTLTLLFHLCFIPPSKQGIFLSNDTCFLGKDYSELSSSTLTLTFM